MAQRVIQNVENDYLMCSICLGRYEEPRLLPCGHTFCAQCLSDHIQQTVVDRNSRHFTCPIDRSQISRPGPNRPPREWANYFPEDTFTLSLLQAVRQHESGGLPPSIPPPGRRPNVSEPIDEFPIGFVNTEGLTCVEHTGRQLEFFCLGCNVLVCAHCAVRAHRRPRCECIAFQEAVERLRPRIETLKRKFQSQMQRIEQLSRGEIPIDSVLENSKVLAMQALDEIENKLGRFSQICLQHVEDLRQQVRNAGNDLTEQNQQLSFIFDNIQDTKLTFDNIMNTNSAPDILNLLPKLESQADEYETAMRASQANRPSKIEITTNTAFENFLRNPPHMGSLKITRAPGPRLNNRETTFNVAQPSVAGPANVRRAAAPPSRRVPTAAVRPTVTPRNPPRQNLAPRRQPTIQKSKSSINVKNSQEDTMTWHLTGIVFVGYTVVVADSFNHMLRRCSIAGSSSINHSMYLENATDVASLNIHNEIAVTQPDKRQIAIIQTDDDALRIKEIVKTQKPYEGICQLSGSNFVVSCTQGRRTIDVIDRLGRMQNSIERSHLLQYPRFLTVIPSGSIVVSDREQRNVTCMSQNGHVEWTYGAPAAPWGVASDGAGKIFVCLDNNCIQTLSDDGSVVQEKFITARDGVRIPYAICARSRQVAFSEYGSSLFAPNSPWVHVISF